MEEQFTAYITSWLTHIRVLAKEIGPRGSTREGERKGSEYCLSVFKQLGLNPETETFQSARSIFQPHLFASIGMLAAFLIYPLGGRISATLAFLISLIALVSDLMELSFRDNLLRRLVSKGPSQNVMAIIPPSGEYVQDLVVIGHVDSQRTPLVFKTETWLMLYKNFTTLAFICFTLQVVIFGLGILAQWGWIWPVSAISALCAVLLAAMCIQADFTPFTAGANDNASGAGLVLALAENFQVVPLQRTRLWMVCSGCEEVQHYGAIDFFRRHLGELHRPKALVFEMLGCSGPAWLVKEGIVIPFHADPGLVELAEHLAKERPDLDAHPASISGGNTEMADALRIGIPAITLAGMGTKGEAPYWHMVEDTFDKMVPGLMACNYDFVWNYIRAIDSTG
jgi:Peptidase family M28